jgi:pyruvate formate-lyase/glycerol dehydratase family glycyl radical enzyme
MPSATSRQLSPRVARLRDRLLSAPYEIDLERARSYTRSWMGSEDEGPCMRAALALRQALEDMTIGIEDEELLAGVKTSKRLAGVIPVERGDFNTVLEVELDRLVRRKEHRFLIDDLERTELEREILPWWHDRTVRSRKARLWKEAGIYSPMRLGPAALFRILEGSGVRNTGKVLYLTLGKSLKSLPGLKRMQRELAALRPNLALTVFDVQGHFVPGYGLVLETGFDGIASRAKLERERLGDSPEETDAADFYDSVALACDAVASYSERYAELAERLASDREGGRAAELLEIATRCRKVPMGPPDSFMEALQSLWMTQVALSISYGMAGVMSVGRLDRYLGPFYECDIASGLITRQEALDALEEYMVKLATELIMLIETGKETASEMGVGSNTITIGGADEDGDCAASEISFLIIEAHDRVKALANNLSIRVSSATPAEFLERACESYRYTSGTALFNDDLIIGELELDGFSRADALDYSIVGCVEPTSTGDCFATTAGNDISLAGVLEMALNEGRMLFSGRQCIGARTPDPVSFGSFEDVRDAFITQLSYNIDILVEAVELLDRAYAESFPSPLVSATMEGCLASGKDVTRGGTLYSFGSVTGRGLGTVADSLAAIRWAVFEERVLTMEELTRLLRTNFRGREQDRQALLRAPKYGSDDPAADELARWVTAVFCDEVRRHRCGRGNFYRPGMFSYGVHVVDGLYLGATPDGRRSGEPVSNGISPVNGAERSGPTAVMHSASFAASPLLSNGSSLNMRLSPRLLERDSNVRKLADLVRGYFEIGGRHVQFNVVDTATLRDAQAHPERHRDLVVRVSGYCAYFTDLGASIQEDIIARTEFCSL